MRLGVTNHAIDRYMERVKPQLGKSQARRELYALLEFAESVDRPHWDLGRADPAAGYLLIAPRCVAIVKGDAVVSVITEELALEPARIRKRKIQRIRRRRRNGRRRGLRGHGNGRPGAPLEDDRWAA